MRDTALGSIGANIQHTYPAMQTGTKKFLINTYGENNRLSFFARIITENGLMDEKNTESLVCARLYLFCSLMWIIPFNPSKPVMKVLLLQVLLVSEEATRHFRAPNCPKI